MADYPFFFVPDPILDRYDPLTVAVYGGIARCCVAASEPVPLSAPDLAQWFGLTGEPGRVAIMRRMQRLTADGWIDSQRQPGKKPKLQPTWGRSRAGALRRWDWELPDRGRPDWQRGRRVPLALFDDYLGRLVPHAATPADHSSWWDRLLLDGGDVGSWMIGLRHPGTSTPRLTHLGIAGTILLTLDELRARQESGTLTTLDNQVTVRHVGCGAAAPSPRSRTRSTTRSAWGSGDQRDHEAPSTAAGRASAAETDADRLIACIVRN
ncbi:MAG: hypothetical protein SH847_01225, partial [Roseiflexaceae bacterium]|nr:hypothetical protein [Roseiflexaceae bacterium]